MPTNPLISIKTGPPQASQLSPEDQASENAFQNLVKQMRTEHTTQDGAIQKNPLLAIQKAATIGAQPPSMINSWLGDAITGGMHTPLNMLQSAIPTEPPNLLKTLMSRYAK